MALTKVTYAMIEGATANALDYGADPTGVADSTAAIQSAIDAGYMVYLPAGVYKITSEIVIKDGTGLIGVSAFWKRRTAYTYANSHTSVLKYEGAGGSNSCVVRVSKKAVGTFGTVFSGANTDDLKNYRLENVHIDANNLAEYAWYFYRAGNSGNVADCLTAEKAAKDNFLFLGMFASYLGTFGAYEAVGRGIVVAEDVFNWTASGSSEFNCYNFNATFIATNNGTSQTFVEYTGFVTDTAADEYNCGIYSNAGRGSAFILSSEGNFGRSAIVTGSSSGAGPVEYTFSYFEGNGAGPKVKAYGRFSNGITLKNGYLYPVTESGAIKAETIKIYPNAANDGPGFSNDWLVLDRLTGASGYVSFNVNSNTNRFQVTNSSGAIQYPTQRPTPLGVFNTGYFKGDATLSDIRFLRGDNIFNNFYGDGATVNFTLAYAPADQNQASVFVNGVLQTVVTDYTISGTTLTFVSAPADGAAIVVSYSNMTLTRTSAGLYQVTFHVAQPNTNYAVTVSTVQNDGQTTAAISAITTTGFEIRTSTVAAPTVLSDTGDFITFMVARNGT